MKIVFGILLPFLGTVFGSFTIYFLHKKISKKLEIIIMGFASGVMIAASIWSLLLPSLENNYTTIWIPTCIGFSLGIITFFLLDILLKKTKIDTSNKINNLMLAITLHNIPEGMAVGVVLASYLAGTSSLATCYALALGIAIQNFPEGAIISFPLLNKGYPKNKAFIYGVISAVFESLGAIITIIFTNVITVLLPYLLSFAAGAMFYVVIVELIPESDSNSKINTIGFLIGFLIMMILDVTLG